MESPSIDPTVTPTLNLTVQPTTNTTLLPANATVSNHSTYSPSISATNVPAQPPTATQTIAPSIVSTTSPAQPPTATQTIAPSIVSTTSPAFPPTVFPTSRPTVIWFETTLIRQTTHTNIKVNDNVPITQNPLFQTVMIMGAIIGILGVTILSVMVCCCRHMCCTTSTTDTESPTDVEVTKKPPIAPAPPVIANLSVSLQKHQSYDACEDDEEREGGEDALAAEGVTVEGALDETLMEVSKSDDSDGMYNAQIERRTKEREMDHKELIDWMDSKGLRHYVIHFVSNGYDSLDYVKDITTVQELIEIGIHNKTDQDKLMRFIHLELNGNAAYENRDSVQAHVMDTSSFGSRINS
eukprot:1039759_1